MSRSRHAHADESGSRALADQTEGLGLFERVLIADAEKEERATALAGHKVKNPELVTRLRAAARDAYAKAQAPISANNIRYVLDEMHYDGDRRVLGVAFAESYWTAFGETATDCEGATATRVGASCGTIRTYVPTHLAAMWAEKTEDERRTA